MLIDDGFRRAAPPAPPPPPPPPPAPVPQEKVHRVRPAETLESIARDYSTPGVEVTAPQIAARNNISDPNTIRPGDTLIVPTVKTHPAPSAPAPTPEAQRVDAAVQSHLRAQDNLAAVDRATGRYHNDPDWQRYRAGYQQQVTQTGTELQDAVTAQIEADYAASASPTGGIYDVNAIGQYGNAIAQRYANDPAAQAVVQAAVQETKLDHEVDTTLTMARAMSDAPGTVRYLNAQLPTLSAEAQTRLFNSTEFNTLLDERVAPAFTDPLQGKPWENSDGAQVEVRESLETLRTLVTDADPRLANALVERGLTALDDLQRRATADGYGMMIGGEGTRALVHIADQVGGTPQGDALVRRMADLPVNGLQIQQAVGEGAAPDLLLAIAANGGTDMIFAQALDGVQQFANGQVAANVDALAKHTEELSWYIANYGGAMTPEQLNQAITDYTAAMEARSPGWEARTRELEAQVAADGQQLLDQIAALQALPSGLAGRQGDADAIVGQVLGDEKSQYAISLALKQHPEYIDTTAGRRLMQNAAYEAKFGEQGLKFSRELANAYVRHNVLSAAENFNPADPGSRATALAAIDKLKNPQLAALLGISESKLANAADALRMSLPTASGESAERIAGRLRELDRVLQTDDYRPAFDKGLPAGQLLRSIGLTFAAVGFVNSADRALGDPTLKNDLRAITDAAALGQKGSELLVGLGRVSDDSLFGRFGSTTSGRVFGVLSAGFDGWSAGESFAQGDWVKGGLYTASAAGGLLAATSGTALASSLGIGAWGGPVGIALVAVSALGLAAKDQSDFANRFQHDETQGRSTQFLAHAGLDQDTARMLVDQSGEGHSTIPLLAKYAEFKGYDLNDAAQRDRFTQWLNDMPHEQLDHVRDWLHHTADEFDGDASRLGADSTVMLSQGTVTSTGGVAVVMDTPRTVGQIDALIAEYGATPLPVV